MNRLLRQSLSAAAAAIAVSSWGSEGSAEAPEVRAHLEVVSTAGCGGQAELTARVVRRSSRIRFVAPGPGVRRARAELRAAGNELFAATLSLWTDEGRELVRRLRPARCADALEALSLVLLVSLDPDAELGEAPAPTPAAEPEAATGSEEAAPSPSAGAARPGAARKPKPRPEPADLEARERESEPGVSGVGGRYRPFAGAFGSVRRGPAPGFMPGVGVFAGVVGAGFPSEFAARLSASRHRRSGFRVEKGAAEFELDALRLELCPIGLRLGAAFFHACLDGELGELEAAGSGLPDSREAGRPWRALGLSGWAGLRPWPVLELSLAGGLEHPLVRDRFEFNPEVFHEVGPVTGWLSLGVGLSIP